MLKKWLFGGAFCIAVLLLWAATRPDTFRVARTIRIQAPADKVFNLLNDFQKFGSWSPWEKLDPNMKRSFTGPQTGQGAVYAWEGNDEVGSGRMEILKTIPNERVTIQLDFFKPFEARNTTDYIVQSEGDQTTVTWAMAGPHPFYMRVMGVVMSMDDMVGKDFESGLANLKAVSERGL